MGNCRTSPYCSYTFVYAPCYNCYDGYNYAKGTCCNKGWLDAMWWMIGIFVCLLLCMLMAAAKRRQMMRRQAMMRNFAGNGSGGIVIGSGGGGFGNQGRVINVQVQPQPTAYGYNQGYNNGYD